MSWGVNFIGTPDNVVKALEAHEEKVKQSRIEYDAAKPYLIGLVRENFT
jgi:hypothetical protein